MEEKEKVSKKSVTTMKDIEDAVTDTVKSYDGDMKIIHFDGDDKVAVLIPSDNTSDTVSLPYIPNPADKKATILPFIPQPESELEELSIQASDEPELTEENSHFTKLQEKFGLNDNELLQLMEFTIDLKDHDITDKYYQRLPQGLKSKIDIICMKASHDVGAKVSNKNMMEIKNKIAKELIDDLKEMMFHDKAFDEYEAEYKELMQEIENEPDVFEKYMQASSNKFKDTILKTAEKYKESDPAKYERIMKLSDIYQEGFNLKYLVEAYESSNKIRRQSQRNINNMKKMTDTFNFLFKREGAIGPGKNIVRIYKAMSSNNTLPFTQYQKDRFFSVLYETVKGYDMTNFTEYSKLFFTLENIEAVSISNMSKTSNVNLARFMDNMRIVIDYIM
jgi:hypothetical protein